MKCPTCGGPKKLHDKFLWEAHQQMHKAYKENLKKIKEIQ